jgi:prephenate dehydratase
MTKPLKVAIQGVKASFHDVAAHKFFNGEILPVECSTFKDLSVSLKNNSSDFALMAIENSIAGSILPNYSLMEQYHFRIVGEVYLRIELSLMALPGQKISSLQTVQSHPMALFQCEEFLHKHPNLKIIESADTAESAKIISERKLAGHAAIASELAAHTYGLEILESGIETNKQNYTRFLVLANESAVNQKTSANKASIRFETHHKPGSLVEVLRIFSVNHMNMTKIQSVPILGKPYQYSFHVDLEWERDEDYRRALGEFASHAVNLIHFGEYTKGEKPKV